MEDVMDDDLFFGLLQANPQIAGKAPAVTASQAAHQMWNGHRQIEGLQPMQAHDVLHPESNTFGESPTSHPPGFEGLWSATQNQQPRKNPDRSHPFGYDASTAHLPIPVPGYGQQGEL
jgi:hypothetical protein